jgi:catechol 2,3-dioxygenase-like lactoylglutathione lyase family enzyme
VVLNSFPDICVADVQSSVAFYRSLLHLDVIVDHGWYAELGVDGRTLLALVELGHETTPAVAQTPPRGVLVSFEVDNALAVYEEARRLASLVLVELVSELGQRHFMIADPDGAVIDIIERVALTRADMRRLAYYRRQHALASTTCH